jgi:hypothetical protein
MYTSKSIGWRYFTQGVTPREQWAAVWAAWACCFAVAEYIAVKSRHPDAPLSAQCRRVLRSHEHVVQRTLGQVTLACGFAWFVRHIYYGDASDKTRTS